MQTATVTAQSETNVGDSTDVTAEEGALAPPQGATASGVHDSETPSHVAARKHSRLQSHPAVQRDRRRSRVASVTTPNILASPILEEQTTSPGGNEPLRCSVCNKSFRNETLLDYHMKYFHFVKSPDGGGMPHRRVSLQEQQSSSHLVPIVRSRARTTSASKCDTLFF